MNDFFRNGGTDAVVVRLTNSSVTATSTVTGLASLDLEAATEGVENPGDWANNLRVTIDNDLDSSVPPNTFNLTLELLDQPVITSQNVLATETFRNVSTDPASPRFVEAVLAQQSQFARVDPTSTVPVGPIVPPTPPPPNPPDEFEAMFTGGDNGNVLDPLDFDDPADPLMRTDKRGIYALEDVDLYNLLNIPPFKLASDLSPGPIEMDSSVLESALKYCQERRAMLIVDPPKSWTNTANAQADTSFRSTLGGTTLGINSMVYFPKICVANPLRDNRLEPVAPGGTMAGLIARTDAQRGVWKAPAGVDASLVGVRELSYPLTDGENGVLNPLGVNCLRTITPYGNISWGRARWPAMTAWPRNGNTSLCGGQRFISRKVFTGPPLGGL